MKSPSSIPIEWRNRRKAKAPRSSPLQDGWTRTLLALEGELGPVDLDLGNGRTLAVAGKVDRIERWDHLEGLSFLRVTDYKTSRKTSLDTTRKRVRPSEPTSRRPCTC